MKYEVKVGQPFEGPLTVTVETTAPPSVPVTVVVSTMQPPHKTEDISFKKAVVFVVVGLAASFLLASVAYAAGTGDYSVVKSFAQTGVDLLDYLVKLAAKNLK